MKTKTRVVDERLWKGSEISVGGTCSGETSLIPNDNGTTID